MIRSEVLAELRSVLADSVAPYFWSDARLMLFLSLGQTQFCRDTGFFRDSTNYPLVTEAGQASYASPAEVIEIRDLTYLQMPLKKLHAPATNISPGPPLAFSTSSDTGKLVLSPTPDAVYVLNTQVWRAARVPFNHVTGGQYDGEMEIPEEFHLAPVEWAAGKAFGDHDSERQDPVKAADHQKNYKNIVREGKRAFRLKHGEVPEIVADPLYLV